MRYSTLISLLTAERIRRTAFATTIAAAHIAVLQGLMVMAPTVTSRLTLLSLQATFIDVSEPERSWQPPVVTASVPPINIAPPRVLLVDRAAEVPARSRAMTAQASLPALQMPTAEPRAPKLLSAVEYVREPSPRYPPQSRRLREQGLVVLRVLIDEKGQACDITVESSSGHVRLDRAAKEAVARAAFRPYVEDGLPRRALVLIPIEFTLTSGSV